MLKFSKTMIIILVGVTFFSGLVASLHYKQLFNDGAYWATTISTSSFWHIEVEHHRYFTLLLQTPAVIAAKLTQSLGLVPALFCLSYFIYPFIALGLICFYTRKSNKFEYIYILVLNFFVAIIPNWAFGVDIVNESIVLGWCLFTYILTSERPKIYLITIFTILLFFTYESGVILYFVAIYLLYREKKLLPKQVAVFSIFFLLQMTIVLIHAVPHALHSRFLRSLPSGLQSPLFYLAVVSIIQLFFFMSDKKLMKNVTLIVSAFATSFLAYKIFNMSELDTWVQSTDNRTWAIPISCLILVTGYELLRKNYFKLEWKVLVSTFIILIPAFIYENKINRAQVTFNGRLKNEISTRKGCNILSPDEWKELQKESYVARWSFAHMSLMYNPTLKIKTILNTNQQDYAGTLIANTPCILKKDNIAFKNQNATYYIPTNQRLDMSQIFP
jgi:hypothetical protein